jgi:integrase
MPSTTPLDICGRRRSPATLPDFHQGRPPRNKGLRYPADPPTVEEIIAVMRAAGDDADAVRLRGLIVVTWRAGLRISEALALNESDLDPSRGAILVRHGKGGICRKQHMPPYVAPGTMLRLVLELERGSGCGVLRARHGEGGDSGRRVLNATYFGGCHRDDRTGSSAPSRSTRPTNLSASASK